VDQNEPNRPGVFSTLRRLASTVLAILQNRLELLAVEWEEERTRIFHALLLTGAVVALGFLTLTAAAVALLSLAWDAFGVKGLFAASGVGLVGTLVAYWRLRVRLKSWPFLSTTLTELKKDRECLDSEK
jgi:uncharacterized membrane protein YqjE